MRSLHRSLVITVLAVLALAKTSQGRKDRNVPHHHRGVLTPYRPGPFAIKLTAQDEAQLEAGHAVMKQTQGGGQAGGAICVQDVDAPKAAVWNQILDLDNYTKKVPKVVHCSNYHVTNGKPAQIKTKMVLGVLPGYSYESYYDHHFYPGQDSLTWTLDYDKTSDMDDVSGHWHLEETPSGRTRVFYACDIKLKGSVPGPILNYLSKSALKTATAWVKKESEKNPNDTRLAQKFHYKVSARAGVVTGPTATRLPAFFRRGGSSTEAEVGQMWGFARRIVSAKCQ